MRAAFAIFTALLVSTPASSRELFGTPAERNAAAWTQSVTRQTLRARLGNSARKVEDNIANNFVGLELITAGPYSGTFESRFGHTLLRFIDRDQDPFNDLVVAFEMVAIDGSRILQDGFNGQSAVAPTAMSMVEVMTNYFLDQQRKITRTILPTNKAQLKVVAEEILTLSQIPSALGNYSFIKNNCDTAMFKLLAEAGFSVPQAAIDIPTFAPERYSRAGYAPFPALTLEENRHVVAIEKSTRFGRAAQRQDRPLIELEVVWDAIGALPLEQIEPLYHQWPAKWASHKFRVAMLLKDKLQTPRPLVQIFQLEALPEALYNSCEEDRARCLQNRLAAARTTWPARVLMDNARRFLYSYESETNRARQLAGKIGRKELCRFQQPRIQANVAFNTMITDEQSDQWKNSIPKCTDSRSCSAAISAAIPAASRNLDSCDQE